MAAPNKHDFDYIDEWAALSDAELQEQYTEKAGDILRRVLVQLGDDGERAIEVDRGTFVPLVRRLRERKRAGSRALGDAIIGASELLKEGSVEEAKSIYGDFIQNCPSKFYRQIAEARLRSLVSSTDS